ncbi:MAG: hypothetical protein AB8B85_20180 [Paracoccaceae bacterium]
MDFRKLGLPVAVMMLLGGMLTYASQVLDSPLAIPADAKKFSYVREQAFSNPAIAGMRQFNDTCADCHGGRAEGTERGPGLLDRPYAKSFRNSEAFHSAVGLDIPAHLSFVTTDDDDSSIGFNTREQMSKFLREARKAKAMKAASQ